MKTKAVPLLCFFLPVLAWSQNKIETDRPTEGLTATTVGKGAFQLETGLRRDWQNATDYSLRHPDLQWRYGLLTFLELRASTVAETQRFPSEGKSGYGLLPVELGAKAGVLQSKDSSLKVALFGEVGFPTWASEDHRLPKAFYRARLLLDKDITKSLSVQVNAGRDWQSHEQTQVWVYAVSPHVDLGEKWQVFAESYGYLQKGEAPEHYLDLGLAYYIGRNVELDVNAGKGLTEPSANYFLTAGISFRLK